MLFNFAFPLAFRNLFFILSTGDNGYYTIYTPYDNALLSSPPTEYFNNDDMYNVIMENNVKTFQCCQCNRTYKLKKTLNRHITHECMKEKRVICQYCGYKTHRNDRLLSHIRIVHPELTGDNKLRPIRSTRSKDTQLQENFKSESLTTFDT